MTQRARSNAGFFSSVAGYSLPAGSRVTPGEIGGYYIDLRVKAGGPDWPRTGAPARGGLVVDEAQWALGCFERRLLGEGERWLAGALACADHLVESQLRSGAQEGGWPHTEPFGHTFELRPPWLSAMAQGEGASVLVRAHALTADERYADAARRALEPFARDVADGGVRTLLDGRPFFEEYPTTTPSFVLNGAIFALWGAYDVAVGLGDRTAQALFDEGVATIAAELHRWDLGYWSRYDLHPHPLVNVASSFYHDLHIKQLRALHRLTPLPELEATAARWERYTSSRVCRGRAFVRKAAFRIAVPRRPELARRLPWSPLRADRG